MAEEFHNSLGGASADQLRSYVARIERLEQELADINAGKSDIYKEAKSSGFCKKTIRKLVSRRKLDRNAVEEEDELLETYEQVLLTGGKAPPNENHLRKPEDGDDFLN